MRVRNWFPRTLRGWGKVAASLVLLAAIGAGCWTAVREFLAGREYRLALADAKRYDPESALIHVRRSLEYRSRSAPAHLLAARLYRQLEDYDRAEEHLHRCKDLQGGTSEELQLENLMLRAAQGDAEAVLDPLIPYIQEKRPESPLVLEAMSVGFLRRYQRGFANKAVEDWIKLLSTKELEWIDQATAFKRARVCIGCPLNQRWETGCGPCNTNIRTKSLLIRG